MKKLFLTILILVVCLSTTACLKKSDAEKFKKEYESLNGKQIESGQVYRNVTIPEENPFIYQTAEELSDRISNNESFDRIDEEYFIENKLRRNTYLINKAYNKILNDDKNNNNNNKDENELK